MDHARGAQVPTTVYTPLEYGACGLSESAAVERFGAEKVEVYHTAFRPLEWAVPQRAEDACYAKLICLLEGEQRIVRLHASNPQPVPKPHPTPWKNLRKRGGSAKLFRGPGPWPLGAL